VKRYGQACAVARGLDVVGDRWSLLVVRELMVGPRRYTDLIEGLPGIGTNVLAARLRDLHEAGIISKATLPPPAAAAVYELTEAGRALAPILSALREWGAVHAPPVQPDDAVRPAWVLMSAARVPSNLEPGRVCEIRAGNEVFRLTAEAKGLSVRGGTAEHPDAVIKFDLDTLYALVTGSTTARAARKRTEAQGDEAVVTEILTLLHGALNASPARSAGPT
jgi:DNA-binding HxlR family transcriptional regulator